jgi:peptidoglycan/xylan/chitin deacetylase (PgdA/CDA1 family)
MGFKRSAIAFVLRGASRAGAWKAIERLGRRLTVLAYHRVVDFAAPAFDTYAANVSATPDAFRAQMDLVRARFDVIDLERLLRWLRGDGDLPARPLLITFDDGYRDNFEHAHPILRDRRLPAVLFVTTGFVGSARTLYWDRLARGFHRTPRSSLSLPDGELHWTGDRERAAALNEVVRRLKLLPQDEKEHRVGTILEALGAPEPAATPGQPLALDWDQVRRMAGDGVDIGGHTHDHPILSRLPLERAEAEIRTCVARIETELGRPARSFAYTNGGASDFGVEHERVLAQLGIQAAFSLIPGPASWNEARDRPLAIRRIMIHWRDDLPRFEAKLAGVARLSRGWL